MRINFNPHITSYNKPQIYIQPKRKDVEFQTAEPISFYGKYTRFIKTVEMERKLIKKAVSNEISLARLANKTGSVYSEKIKEIKKEEDALLKRINTANLKNTRTDQKPMPKTELDYYVTGYYDEKVNLTANLIDPIEKGSHYLGNAIPSAILLHGDESELNNFMCSVIERLDCKIEIPLLHTFYGEIESELTNMLNEAQKRYLKTGRRTLIIFPKPEKYLNFSLEAAEILGRKLSEGDKKLLNRLNKNKNLVSYFKALLDVVANVPDKTDKNSMKCATTFLMTSENPHLIHPDLSERQGKIRLMKIDFARDENLKNIILENMRRCDNYFVDYIADEEWRNVVRELNPKFSKGAFSSDAIKKHIKNFYEEDSTKRLNGAQKELGVIRTLLNAKRDISGEVVKKRAKIVENFENKQKKVPMSLILELIDKKELGLITKKEEVLYEEKIRELKELQDFLNIKSVNGKLSKREEKLKKQIEKIMKLI